MEFDASSSFSLLCEEDSASFLGSDNGHEGDMPELGRNLGFVAELPLESYELVRSLMAKEKEHDELVRSLMAKEKEQLAEVDTTSYMERLNAEGLELSWRTDFIEWICKVQPHYSFGPLCVYLAVNYLDRFLSSNQLPDDTPWMQQLVAVACISLAAKMEETVVPQSIYLHVCGATHTFEPKTIQRMEVLVLSTLKWRMHSVTPFSYIDYFLNIFNEGKPLTNDLVSRCTELILRTIKETKFLKFEPSEIATAVALSVAMEAQSVDFNIILSASEIPLNKENVERCHEAMQEMTQEENDGHISATSPSGVLGASCFTYCDGSSTPGSSQTASGNYGNNSQFSSPTSKRTRLSSSPMV